MPYIIAIIVVVVATGAFLLFRTPAVAPVESEPVTTAPAPATDTQETPVTTETESTADTASDATPGTAAGIPTANAPTGEPDISTVPDEVSEPDTAPVSEASGTNGTFSADASYLTPRRTNHDITVSLTLENDVVTAAEVLYDGSPTASSPSHSGFDSAYETEVIGKTLDDINLSRVGGASLTSTAFNEAVADIRAQI